VTVERGAARVQRLDTGGQPLSAWPVPLGRGTLGVSVAVDDSGRVAVADERGGRLWLWSANGEPLLELTGLAHPRAIAFASDGDLVVAESAPARVRRVRPERAVEGARGAEH
ncbi:MAG: hypothetical protein HOP12_05925, partial [Candidatus Eisenbacteria bacterium]|nr:hypothetical protein [Candidatus Eisenbacteria bacterium]